MKLGIPKRERTYENSTENLASKRRLCNSETCPPDESEIHIIWKVRSSSTKKESMKKGVAYVLKRRGGMKYARSESGSTDKERSWMKAKVLIIIIQRLKEWSKSILRLGLASTQFHPALLTHLCRTPTHLLLSLRSVVVSFPEKKKEFFGLFPLPCCQFWVKGELWDLLIRRGEKKCLQGLIADSWCHRWIEQTKNPESRHRCTEREERPHANFPFIDDLDY